MRLFWVYFLFIGLGCSCSASNGRSAADGSGNADNPCEKRIKRCKLEACHIRRLHLHEGACFKGKKKWFLKRLFFCNKDPKVGQGYKKQRRDQHQHPHR